MAADDFFRDRLDQVNDVRNALPVLATRLPWTEIEASLAPLFAHLDPRVDRSVASIRSTEPVGGLRGDQQCLPASYADPAFGVAAVP